MSEKTFNQRKLDLIVFIALCEDEEILRKIEEILDQLKERKSKETSDV